MQEIIREVQKAGWVGGGADPVELTVDDWQVSINSIHLN